jgi:hypothetical protein
MCVAGGMLGKKESKIERGQEREQDAETCIKICIEWGGMLEKMQELCVCMCLWVYVYLYVCVCVCVCVCIYIYYTCISQEPRRVPAPCVLLANMARLVLPPPQLRPARHAQRARILAVGILKQKVCLVNDPLSRSWTLV